MQSDRAMTIDDDIGDFSIEHITPVDIVNDELHRVAINDSPVCIPD